MESKGKVLHLHAAICRFDENGDINNSHNTHLRAQRTTEQMTKKSDWMTAEKIRSCNIPEVSREWMEILKNHAIVYMGRVQEGTCPEKLFRMNGKTRNMDYTYCRSSSVFYTLSYHSRTEQHVYIPERVLDYFNEEFDYREVANSRELTNMAVALFVGMIDTPAVSTGGDSGGAQSNLPWQDKDDDDLQWAHRCERAATLLLGKKPRTGLKR